MAEASPLDGLYQAQLAKLLFQREKTYGENRLNRRDVNASTAYAKKQLTTQAQQRYAGNRNQANAGGILESGQLAQRQGQTQASYAGQQTRYAEQRKAAIERYNTGDKNAAFEYDKGQYLAEEESGQRAKEALERNPLQGDTTGGVVPKVSTQPGAGFVRVGYPQRSQNPGEHAVPNVRREAARKAALRKRFQNQYGGPG